MKNAIKRLLALALMLTLLLLSACSGGGLNADTETAEKTGTETASSETKDEGLTVGQPYTRAMLDENIPVANASMTEDQLRQICLDFAKMQGTVPWISASTVRYNLDDSSQKEMLFTSRVIYAGLPYTHAGSNLYTFLDYLDPETGLLDPAMVNRVGDLLGDNCCTSLFWAWSRVSSSITFTHTQVVVPSKGMIPVGPYTFDQTIDSYKSPTTKEICDANGEQTMFESYARLKVADGVVVNTQTSAAGAHHVMMCSVEPHVVRLANGNINAEESYVNFVDQSSGFRRTKLESGKEVDTNAGIDNKVTFSSLFFQGYLPFTIPELIDPSSVQKAKAEFSLENGAELSAKDLEGVTVSSNYAISKLIILVTASDGTVSDFSTYANGVAHYEMDLGSRGVTLNRQLQKGSYKLEISALVGSGETLPVFTGTLIKN